MVLMRDKTWERFEILVGPNEGPTGQTGQEYDDVQHRQCWYELVRQMISGPTAPWTIVSSCGKPGGTWQHGAADYWTEPEGVRYKESSGNQFSWIVLQQNGIANGFQLLIQLGNNYNGTYQEHKFYASASGSFTGGNETTRPTAVDEIWADTGGDIFPVNNATISKGMILLISTDGACTRIITCGNQQVYCTFVIERLKNPSPPSHFQSEAILATLTARNDYHIYCAETPPGGQKSARVSGHTVQILGIVPMIDKILPSEANMRGPDQNGDYLASEIVIFADGPGRGIIGTLYDCYVISDALKDGDYFPADGSKQFFVSDTMLLASDGTDVSIA